MIVEAIMNLLFGLAEALFAALKAVLPNAPQWVADLADGVTTVLNMIPAAVRWFVPLGPTAAIGLTLAGLFVAAGLLRITRRVVSLFTGGGGNA